MVSPGECSLGGVSSAPAGVARGGAEHALVFPFVKTILNKAIPVAVLAALALTSCASPASDAAGTAEANSGPATVTSCGLDLSVGAAPERAITLEQGATEVMLALGLHDSMIGTSYLTDAVADEYEAAYADIPVLSDQYPTTEQVREEGPDFVYSMRASGFTPDAAGTRAELVDLGVPAYLSANDCEDPALIPDSFEFESIFAEIADIASIFRVEQRGEEIIAEQRAALADVEQSATALSEAPSIVWLYSTINGAPIVAGNAGLPEVLGSLVGGTNAFSDLDSQWMETSWDTIAQRDPDVIVVADLSRGLDGDSAADKIAFLQGDVVASQLSAVAEERVLSVPAAELDPSVRSVGAATDLSTELLALYGGN